MDNQEAEDDEYMVQEGENENNFLYNFKSL